MIRLRAVWLALKDVRALEETLGRAVAAEAAADHWRGQCRTLVVALKKANETALLLSQERDEWREIAEKEVMG